MIGNIDFFAERRDYAERIAIYARINRNGKRAYPKEIVWEELGDSLPINEPLLSLATEEAQRLMDELWQAGLRPTQAKQSHGAFDAQGQHLADMRAIAFAKLKVERP